MSVAQIRLSSKEVMSNTHYVTVNLWRDRVVTMSFEYCESGCKHSDEHDYAFDGQFFYQQEIRNE